MNVKSHPSCALCGHNNGQVKVYRDPFGTAIAPGRWPNLTMHSDCFLIYIRATKAAGPPSIARWWARSSTSEQT